MIPAAVHTEKSQMVIVKAQTAAKGSCLLVKLPFCLSVFIDGTAGRFLFHDSVNGPVFHSGTSVHEYPASQTSGCLHTVQGACHIAGLNLRRVYLLPVHASPGHMEKAVCMSHLRDAFQNMGQVAGHCMQSLMNRKGVQMKGTRTHQGVHMGPLLQKHPGQIASDKTGCSGNYYAHVIFPPKPSPDGWNAWP